MCALHPVIFVVLHGLNALGAIAGATENATSSPSEIANTFLGASGIESGVLWGYQVIFLLNDPAVQHEIDLTPQQRIAMRRLSDAYLDATVGRPRDAAEGKTTLSEKSDSAREAFWKLVAENVKTFGAKSVGILSQKQKARMVQVVFQLRSVEIFHYPEVAKCLRLTEGQTAEIERIRTSVIEEARALQSEFMRKKWDRRSFDASVDRLMEHAKSRAVRTLTDIQRETLAQIEGRKNGFSRWQLVMEIRKSRDGKDSMEKDSH